MTIHWRASSRRRHVPADATDAAPRPVADDELTARVSVAVADMSEVAEPLDGDLEAELEQIDFFIEQSLLEEARQSLAELAARFPDVAPCSRRCVR